MVDSLEKLNQDIDLFNAILVKREAKPKGFLFSETLYSLGKLLQTISRTDLEDDQTIIIKSEILINNLNIALIEENNRARLKEIVGDKTLKKLEEKIPGLRLNIQLVARKAEKKKINKFVLETVPKIGKTFQEISVFFPACSLPLIITTSLF